MGSFPTLGALGALLGGPGLMVWKFTPMWHTFTGWGIACEPVAVEITYGTERLAMYLQGVESVFEIVWNRADDEVTTYADVHKESEYQFSRYHFEVADVDRLLQEFDFARDECNLCLEKGLPLPAYDECMKASHIFNVLDARKAISQLQRQNYILKVRDLAIRCAKLYKEQEGEREKRVVF